VGGKNITKGDNVMKKLFAIALTSYACLSAASASSVFPDSISIEDLKAAKKNATSYIDADGNKVPAYTINGMDAKGEVFRILASKDRESTINDTKAIKESEEYHPDGYYYSKYNVPVSGFQVYLEPLKRNLNAPASISIADLETVANHGSHVCQYTNDWKLGQYSSYFLFNLFDGPEGRKTINFDSIKLVGSCEGENGEKFSEYHLPIKSISLYLTKREKKN